MADAVEQEGEAQRGDDGGHPLRGGNPVGLLVADAARRLVDVRQEEAQDGGHEVPREVDGGQEAGGAECDAVLEEHADVVDETGLFAAGLSGFELAALLQPALEIPGDEGHHEEREEHHARREHVERIARQRLAADGMSQRLHPGEEIAAGREEHAQKQDDHRAHAPRHLGDADVAAARVHLGTLADVGPRGRYAHADGDARDEEARQQHGEVDAEHDEQHARHIDQQVVGEDELAPVAVGQKAADDGADGGAQAVGADEVEPPQMHLGEAEILLPEGQAAGAGNDGTGIQIVGERHRNGALEAAVL